MIERDILWQGENPMFAFEILPTLLARVDEVIE
jgi:hypothetical protein